MSQTCQEQPVVDILKNLDALKTQLCSDDHHDLGKDLWGGGQAERQCDVLEVVVP